MNLANWLLLSVPIVGAVLVLWRIKVLDSRRPMTRVQDQEHEDVSVRRSQFDDQYRSRRAEVMTSEEIFAQVMPPNPAGKSAANQAAKSAARKTGPRKKKPGTKKAG